MRCPLMEANGLRGECTTDGCVYWALLTGSDEEPARGCALTHFGLVGPVGDRLARWLFDLRGKVGGTRHSEPSLSRRYAVSARSRADAWSINGGGYGAAPPSASSSSAGTS